MFALTRKTDYALVALTAMVQEPHLVSARGLADRLDLPLPVLRNILKRLTQVGLVTSARGQQGGYQLARRADAISLVDLIEAIEGPLRLTVCCSDNDEQVRCHCEREGACSIKRPVQRVHGLIKQLLSRVTLAHIAADALPGDLAMITSRTMPNGEPRIPITNH